MRKPTTVALTIVAMALAVLGWQSPALAVNEVACGTRTDLAKAWDVSGTHCYANAGAMSINLTNVTRLCAGNNVVSWTVWPTATSATQLRQNRWQCNYDVRFVKATRVSIS
ncbi:beta/gamma crystallin domain-containing protein [Cryptosporangium arvum]|nr:beta/gamma crystallin domain-containing protein [Cryptosporangium arvum]